MLTWKTQTVLALVPLGLKRAIIDFLLKVVVKGGVNIA